MLLYFPDSLSDCVLWEKNNYVQKEVSLYVDTVDTPSFSLCTTFTIEGMLGIETWIQTSFAFISNIS